MQKSVTLSEFFTIFKIHNRLELNYLDMQDLLPYTGANRKGILIKKYKMTTAYI